MPLLLQSRDREILQFVFKFRVATYDQIRRKFFSKNHKSIADRRILDLCKCGYLNSNFIGIDQKPVKYVSLSALAWPHIKEHWPFEIDRPYFKSESPRHDIRLLEVMMRFEALSAFDKFLSENLLQSTSSLLQDPVYRDLVNIQADGALELKDPQGRSYLYAIEFESSIKAPERYQKKLSAYYRVGGIDGVIYICGDQKIMNLVVKVNDHVRTTKDTVFYSGLELSVLKSTGKLFFKSSADQGIALS